SVHGRCAGRGGPARGPRGRRPQPSSPRALAPALVKNLYACADWKQRIPASEVRMRPGGDDTSPVVREISEAQVRPVEILNETQVERIQPTRLTGSSQ